MNKNDYLEMVEKAEIRDEMICIVEKKYNRKLPSDLGKIVSFMSNPLFLNNGYRIISFDELVNAEERLQVDFVGLGMIPIIDTGDNDFIVFCFEKNEWARFNIVDECIFGERKALNEIL